MVPVWFHVVPARAIDMETVASLKRNHQNWCGSCVVPCGSLCGPQAKTVVSLQQSAEIGVVPAWFHVVPGRGTQTGSFVSNGTDAWPHVAGTWTCNHQGQHILCSEVLLERSERATMGFRAHFQVVKGARRPSAHAPRDYR